MICGDFVSIERTGEATTAVLADGIGTGVKARVAAVMYASRLMELIRLGFTLREACARVIDTMHEARTSDVPFAAFAVCRILNSGHATILSYEIPPPILVDRRLAAYLPQAEVLSAGSRDDRRDQLHPRLRRRHPPGQRRREPGRARPHLPAGLGYAPCLRFRQRLPASRDGPEGCACAGSWGGSRRYRAPPTATIRPACSSCAGKRGSSTS